MDMIGKIRRMHRRDKKTKREISRATGLSRNTVAKWLDEAQPVEPKYRREAAKATKLSAHEAELKQALKADAKRPKNERRTAKALFTQIKAAGYEGGYTRVTDFIRKWRQGEGQQAACKAFVPLTFELGEAFQFDWSEDGLLVGGVYYRMQVSHMKLCASGAFWLVAYPSQGHEMLFGVLSRNRRKFRQPINVACPAPGRWGRPNSRVTSRHFDHGNASRTSRPDCSGLDEAD